MKIQAALLLFFIVAYAYAWGQNAPVRDIKDLEFMSGQWVTTGQWGDMEETWSKPMGNSMMCSYRCVKNGKVIFYEFIVIEQQPTGPVMKLRHFNPGLIAWEDKDKPYDYPLMYLDLDEKVARFERPDKKTALTFQRISANELKVILERQDKDGKWVQDEFNYKSAKP